ncbi:conserved hypothetical protein [Candidatus Desulfosporosinus infrequens]|uniref:Uncharacterized protein n=1 Tax=Candidatus Desulfosporosinus infrequens TaxID=2043169 RepID=A0A2U3LWE3_9FIRM|nr:conserved hypothetical protein [Candidatus Desulfosporosinus infrequens]
MRPVSLKEIVNLLDCFLEEWNYYLNKKTGEIVEIQIEYLSIAEESEDDDDFSEYEDWEQAAIREAVDMVENWGDYVELPDQEEVNQYRIMENFCFSQEDEKLRHKLCEAIDGKNAFSRFRDAIVKTGIEKEWDSYKHETLCEYAREWCEFHEIEYN